MNDRNLQGLRGEPDGGRRGFSFLAFIKPFQDALRTEMIYKNLDKRKMVHGLKLSQERLDEGDIWR